MQNEDTAISGHLIIFMLIVVAQFRTMSDGLRFGVFRGSLPSAEYSEYAVLSVMGL